MSAPTSSPKSPKATAPADGDHRKRRRNRTTQSCLNCHATKRMCDRKRPCTRCTQLGISGNCVYEVDDPSRQGQGDESIRLMNRISELEGVIRELKNKSQMAGSPAPSDQLLNSRRPSPSNNLSWPASPTQGYRPSSWGTRTPSGERSPTASRQNDPLASLISAYTGLTDHMFVRKGGNCGCLSEWACYTVVLELSLQLRKAADVLARSPSHSSLSDCALNSHISDLDTFAKNVLLDLPHYDSFSHSSWMPGHGAGLHRGSGFGQALPLASGSHHEGIPFDSAYVETTQNANTWNVDQSDSFMSWPPQRRNL